MRSTAGSRTIAAAFANERDASYAMRLIASIADHDIRYTLRRVLGERGDVQMVVLEATVPEADLAERLETAMLGAHGILIPPDALANAGSSTASASRAG
jgi:hypothetical protein